MEASKVWLKRFTRQPHQDGFRARVFSCDGQLSSRRLGENCKHLFQTRSSLGRRVSHAVGKQGHINFRRNECRPKIRAVLL